jgi:Arc/MetJ-type ribon-helix-helix transcriptional regulator
MVLDIATSKVTITPPDHQVEEIRNRVASLEAPSVSEFIQQAVGRSLANAAEFQEMIRRSLQETGGPVTAKEKVWARKIVAPANESPNP